MFLYLCILFTMMYTAASSAMFAHLHNSVWRHGASYETQSWNHLSVFKSFYWIACLHLHKRQHYTSPGTLTCYPPRKLHQALVSGGFVGFHYLSRIEVRGVFLQRRILVKAPVCGHLVLTAPILINLLAINSVVFERLMNKSSILFLREFQGFGASLPRTRDRG